MAKRSAPNEAVDIIMRHAFIIFLILFPSVSATIAQDESLEWRIENVAGLKVTEVKNFLSELQKNVTNNDRAALCAMMSFPLRTSNGDIKDVTTCETKYTQIFNKRVIDAIRAQKYEDLFVRYTGVMIGSGEVWISGICRSEECEESDLKVITINNE